MFLPFSPDLLLAPVMCIHDCSNSKQQEENTNHEVGNEPTLALLLVTSHVFQVLVEFVLICLQVLTEVVQGQGRVGE